MRAALPLAFLAVLLTGFTPEDEALDPTTLPGAVVPVLSGFAPPPLAGEDRLGHMARPHGRVDRDGLWWSRWAGERAAEVSEHVAEAAE